MWIFECLTELLKQEEGEEEEDQLKISHSFDPTQQFTHEIMICYVLSVLLHLLSNFISPAENVSMDLQEMSPRQKVAKVDNFHISVCNTWLSAKFLKSKDSVILHTKWLSNLVNVQSPSETSARLS